LTITLAIFVVVSLLFGFLNGMHDSSNLVSTVISSRAIAPERALAIVALSVFVGPFIFGTAVATTIGNSVLDARALTMAVVSSGLVAAVVWNLVTWYLGIPSSSSHALIGGLVGAAIADSALSHLRAGISTINDFYAIFSVIKSAGIIKVLLALFISPPLGLFAGFFIMRLILWLSRHQSPGVNRLFKRAQVLGATGLALSHGANDGQKTMGVIAMGLVASGGLSSFRIPFWVVAISALAMSIGTASGGWRLIRTLGGKFYKIRPVHGITVQVSAAAVVLGAALVGGPVSTTQVVSCSILGAGSAERINMVRWNVGAQIVLTWIVTIPAAGLFAAMTYFVVRWLV
jgi:inorganic phosphate transporter, PiT family